MEVKIHLVGQMCYWDTECECMEIIYKIANIESMEVFTFAHTHTTKMHNNLKIDLHETD